MLSTRWRTLDSLTLVRWGVYFMYIRGIHVFPRFPFLPLPRSRRCTEALTPYWGLTAVCVLPSGHSEASGRAVVQIQIPVECFPTILYVSFSPVWPNPNLFITLSSLLFLPAFLISTTLRRILEYHLPFLSSSRYICHFSFILCFFFIHYSTLWWYPYKHYRKTPYLNRACDILSWSRGITATMWSLMVIANTLMQRLDTLGWCF